MSTAVPDVNFFRGILVGLVFATVASAAGLVYTLLSVPYPPPM